MVNDYVPRQRDIVFIDFSETKGHEQKGIRPALVISNDVFNKFTKMAIVCPITSNNKKFPTHYLLENTKKVTGSVLCEHIRSIDYEVRNLEFVEKCSSKEFDNIIQLLTSCIE